MLVYFHNLEQRLQTSSNRMMLVAALPSMFKAGLTHPANCSRYVPLRPIFAEVIHCSPPSEKHARNRHALHFRWSIELFAEAFIRSN